MNKNILITGGNGFVGKEIVKFVLKNKNYKIKLILRSKDQADKFNKNKNIEIIYTKNLFLENYNWWVNVLKTINVVIHAAWYVKPGEYMDSKLNLECLNGTIVIAKAIKETNVEKFIGLGTCFEYHIENRALDINAPLNPISIYAKSKAATFLTLSSMFSLMNVKFVWCRLFYLYGEGEYETRLVPTIKTNLSKNIPVKLRSKNKVRDFLNVTDAGDLIVNQIENNKSEVVNICSGKPITIENFVYKIADKLGKRNLITFEESNIDIFDPEYVLGVLNEK